MLLLSTAVPDLSSLTLDLKDISLRLLCAMVIGLIIGTEREYTNRPAGMRTHILVALGACAVMMTGQMIFVQYRPFGSNADPARLGAQVITGVGFLGAGTILRDGFTVRGLTTAASLWSVACLGIAAGGGYYGVAIAGTVFIFITLTFFELIQRKLLASSGREHLYEIETTDIAKTLNTLDFLGDKYRFQLHNIHILTQADNSYRLTLDAEFSGFRMKKRQEAMLAQLIQASEIRSVHQGTQHEGASHQ